MRQEELPAARLLLLAIASVLLAVACSREMAAPVPGDTLPEPVPGSPPVAVFDEPTHDFGNVPRGERVEHSFVVRNRGGTDLAIERVEAADVLTVEGFDELVPSAGEGAVRVAFDAGAKMGWRQYRITVFTNDSEKPERNLYLKGQVVDLVAVEPQNRVYFLDVLQGQGAEAEVTLVNHQDRPLRILEVAAGDPSFVETALETVEEGQRYRLNLSLHPDTPAGRFEEAIRVTTDSPDLPELTIYALATIRERIHADPRQVRFSRILFDDLGSEAVSHKRVRISQKEGRVFEVTAVSTDVPFLDLEIETEEPGLSFLVHLRIHRGRARRGVIDGALKIETDDPEFAEIELPISGEIL